ncbi:MAG TPA: phosphoribosylanthranilate isomerase, partial [Candidatus Limnocylindria bacterium]|nr:phosphoribosylanthranilate isomerase [Candidatus Limnocylindria bacterium]
MDFKDAIQVAGVIDQAEAELLVKCGIRYLGFPLRLTVHREDLREEEAAAIIRNLKPPGRAVLITYLNRPVEIVELCRELGASIVQLHGEIDPSELRRIKERESKLLIIKSLVIGLHVVEELRDLVQRTAPYVDAYITDTFDPETGA